MKTIKICLLTLCVALMCVLPVSAESQVLAAFSFDNAGAVAEDNIELLGYGDKDKGYNSTMGDAELYASVDGETYRKLEWSKDDYSGFGMQPVMTGGNKHPWGEGAYLEVQVSTRGCQNVAFSAKLGATNKGPRDYQLQYSTDGTNFENIGEVYSLPNNKSLEKAFDNVMLPAAANNQKIVYIRMAVVGDTLVNGTSGLVGTTSGETAINDIVITAEGAGLLDRGNLSITEWAIIGGVAVLVTATVIVMIVVFRKKKTA